MQKRAPIIRLVLALAFGAASVALIPGEPAKAQTTQQPAASAPGTATTMPATPSMPMQQMEHGRGMGGMGMSGSQEHQGMMGGQGQSAMPMGSMPQCPPGQTASGNPPTCQ
jgi:hypothetical protein